MRETSGTGSPEPAAHFGGFPPDTLCYLRDLRENNEKSWFEAHRGEYEPL